MKRLILSGVVGLMGLALAIWGLLVPAFFKAMDAQVLAGTGKATPSVADQGLDLIRAGKIGPARMLLLAASKTGGRGVETLERSLGRITDPGLLVWGGRAPELAQIFKDDPRLERGTSVPILQWLVAERSRVKVLAFLEGSPRHSAQEVLQTRALTNLVHFSPLASSSGQPYDAVTLLAGLLLHGEYLARPLRNGLESLIFGALRRGQVQPLELAYMDLLSLGNRLDWTQLTELLGRVESVETLRDLANFMRARKGDFPFIYAGVLLTGTAEGVVRYVKGHAMTGMEDLRQALGMGQGAVARLLADGRRVYQARLREAVTPYDPIYSMYRPVYRLTLEGPWWVAILAKYVVILLAGMVLVQVGSLLGPLLGTLPMRKLLGMNQWVFAVFFLLLALTLSEPFLMSQSKTLEFPLHWKFPMVGGAVPAAIANRLKPMMDMLTLLALVAFLVIQGIIYAFCLLKLAEIRRQPVSSQVKLRLLENEENMFDSGLYAGLGGTVASLVMLAMGIIKPSLMAAYSSTLFGIIFVAILKIGHLRPLRKALILDSADAAS